MKEIVFKGATLYLQDVIRCFSLKDTTPVVALLEKNHALVIAVKDEEPYLGLYNYNVYVYDTTRKVG